MSNDLDRLMNEDPLNLSAQDIDAIIKYEREAYHRHQSGAKPLKESGPAVEVNLAKLGLVEEQPKMRRI